MDLGAPTTSFAIPSLLHYLNETLMLRAYCYYWCSPKLAEMNYSRNERSDLLLVPLPRLLGGMAAAPGTTNSLQGHLKSC